MAATGNGISAGLSLGSAFGQSRALKNQAAFEQRQADFNSRMANDQAEDALKRGEEAAMLHRKKVGQVVGSQRAALAAQGVQLDSGTAMELQKDTTMIGAEDAITIKNNAWREAWGFKSQSSQYQLQSSLNQMTAKNQSFNTLLGGGLQAASYMKKGSGSIDKAPSTEVKVSKATPTAGGSYRNPGSIA